MSDEKQLWHVDCDASNIVEVGLILSHGGCAPIVAIYSFRSRNVRCLPWEHCRLARRGRAE
jgi:hypothetical protein